MDQITDGSLRQVFSEFCISFELFVILFPTSRIIRGLGGVPGGPQKPPKKWLTPVKTLFSYAKDNEKASILDLKKSRIGGNFPKTGDMSVNCYSENGQKRKKSVFDKGGVKQGFSGVFGPPPGPPLFSHF